jgi:hypothetical protein
MSRRRKRSRSSNTNKEREVKEYRLLSQLGIKYIGLIYDNGYVWIFKKLRSNHPFGIETPIGKRNKTSFCLYLSKRKAEEDGFIFM